tara:strand:+ start:3721 stop:4626 length:906 start_codon:yes stop_codon:yes gene_type:complete
MNVIVIGLGNIGLGSKNIKNFKSHANFFHKSKKFNLFAVIDRNSKKLNLFKSQFSTKKTIMLNNLNKLKIEKKKIDVVCISTPTEKIYSIARQIVKLKIEPKVIILEKPVAYTLRKFKEVISIFRNNKVIINYQRIFEKNYSKIFNNLKKKKNLNIKIIFNNGLFENYSHLLSLLIFYFGKPIKIKKNFEKERKDFSLDFKNNIKVNCNGINNYKYNILDMIIYDDKKKINFFSGGHHISTEKIYFYNYLKNYKLLKKETELKLEQIFSLDFFLSKNYTKKLQKKIISCAEETIKILNKLS